MNFQKACLSSTNEPQSLSIHKRHIIELETQHKYVAYIYHIGINNMRSRQVSHRSIVSLIYDFIMKIVFLVSEQANEV